MWRFVGVLLRPRGATVAQLRAATGIARATVYRYTKELRANGLPIDVETINGEARYRLALPATTLRPSARQIAALRLARAMLAPAEGTALVAELDSLLGASSSRTESVRTRAAVPSMRERPAPYDPAVVAQLERAIERGRTIRFSYRGARDARMRDREADPLALRLAADHLYLAAHDLERNELRTFKVARIDRVLISRTRAARHAYDLDAAFAASVKGAWHGAPHDVVVLLAPGVAHIAHEWPLHPDQRTERQSDGWLRVEASVAGIEETVRWVLSWGRNARAESPAELVHAVCSELDGARALYGDAAMSRGSRDTMIAGPAKAGAKRAKHTRTRAAREGRGA